MTVLMLREAARYRFTMAARYSRLDRGLMGTHPPYRGIVPVTCIMSQRLFSNRAWVTFNMSQFGLPLALAMDIVYRVECVMTDAEGTMNQKKVIDAVRSAAVNNRLTCERAHNLARELNVSLREIGAVCNELKIKVSDCQLGCF